MKVKGRPKLVIKKSLLIAMVDLNGKVDLKEKFIKLIFN